MTDISKEQYLELTPAVFLKDGYFSENGNPIPELETIYALAVARQLFENELAPQELSAFIEAIKQTIVLYDEAFPRRLINTLDEAREIVSHMYKKPLNLGLFHWVEECAARVSSEDDYNQFLGHAKAVIRHYIPLAALSA